MRISRLTLVVLLFGSVVGATAQSLWSPGFSGYLSGKSSLQVGDLVSITINTDTKLSYTASNVTDRTLTLEFSGGAAGGPLSFLSPGTTGEKSSLKGGDEIKLSTTLVARVERLDSMGHAFVQGSRTLEVNGRAEMVSVSGWLDPSMLTGERAARFDSLADSKLIYSSTLMQNKPVLTESDITQALTRSTGGTSSPATPTAGQPSARQTPSGGTGAATGPAGPTTSGSAAAQPPAAGIQLTEAAKRRLLLEYLNKMLDLIFAKGSP